MPVMLVRSRLLVVMLIPDPSSDPSAAARMTLPFAAPASMRPKATSPCCELRSIVRLPPLAVADTSSVPVALAVMLPLAVDKAAVSAPVLFNVRSAGTVVPVRLTLALATSVVNTVLPPAAPLVKFSVSPRATMARGVALAATTSCPPARVMVLLACTPAPATVSVPAEDSSRLSAVLDRPERASRSPDERRYTELLSPVCVTSPLSVRARLPTLFRTITAPSAPVVRSPSDARLVRRAMPPVPLARLVAAPMLPPAVAVRLLP
ncbi:hypothetical protein D3C72_1325810 [compost metagenome]